VSEPTDTSPPVATPCSQTNGVLSEGPCWEVGREELLWVDIVGKQLHRAQLGPDGSLHAPETVSFDRPVAAVAPAADGGYILAAGTGFLFLDASGKVHELAQPESANRGVRMNDGACDPQGRFWAGSMAEDESPGAGALYRLGCDGSCLKILDGLTISNGIGWSPDGSVMYLADSGARCIDAFDFDGSSGDLDGRRTIVRVTEPGAAPDGLTVDARGEIWVAMWDGAAVRRYSAQGDLVATVPMPVDRPTSCAFGGRDLATLFVTTARHGLEPAALARQPDAGRVFRVDGLGATGLRCSTYRGAVGAHHGRRGPAAGV
jgi:sugar lactone lactonase YvrE